MTSKEFTELGRLLRRRKDLVLKLEEVDKKIGEIVAKIRENYEVWIGLQGEGRGSLSSAIEYQPQVVQQVVRDSGSMSVEQIRAEAFSSPSDAPPLEVAGPLKILEKYLKRGPIVPAQPQKEGG
jgi:hypothetical protein